MYDLYPYKGTQRHSYVRRQPCDDGIRDWSDAAANQGMTRIDSHRKLGRGKEGFSPMGFKGSMDLLIP